MLSLTCMDISDGSVFPVAIAEGASVHALKKAIATLKRYSFPAHELKLFAAKKADGAWLSADDALDEAVRILMKGETTGLMDQEMRPAVGIDVYFDEQTPMINSIHVLVDRPRTTRQDVNGTKATETPEEVKPSGPPRKRKERWDELNQILEGARSAKRGEGSPAVTMDMLSDVYEPIELFTVPVKDVPPETLARMQHSIASKTKAYGSPFRGHEAERLRFVESIVVQVVKSFEEDDPPAMISHGEGSSGNYVKAMSHLDMTLARECASLWSKMTWNKEWRRRSSGWKWLQIWMICPLCMASSRITLSGAF